MLNVYDKCPTLKHLSQEIVLITTTFLAGDDGRGWWLMTVMVLLLSLVQLPWFTPCPENTGL